MTDDTGMDERRVNAMVGTTERQRGAAAALALEMLDRAITAQREGGTAVEVITKLDEPTARALGFWGKGEITLTLEPAFGQLPGDLDRQHALDQHRKGG